MGNWYKIGKTMTLINWIILIFGEENVEKLSGTENQNKNFHLYLPQPFLDDQNFAPNTMQFDDRFFIF